jgi:prephenate dehydratase
MKIEMTLLRHQIALQSEAPLLHIASHPAALLQISKWKSSHPLVKEIPIAEGTAEAARKLAMGELEMNTAVIGPKNLTLLYPQLVVIEEGIQDRQDNYTTFILVEVVKRSHPMAGDVVIAELDDLLHAQLSQ